ncbi:MAG: ATP-binding protein [Acidimicrobiales bacterium]
MDFGVLGRLTVTRDGRDVAPRGPLQRRLLCALLLRADSVVATDELADLLWPDRLPANHLAALQTHVFRLRRLLPEGVVDSSPAGYRLTVVAEAVDAARFEAAVYQAAALRSSDPGAAASCLDAALGWWRGAPYDELADVDAARIEAGRLTELQLRATEERHDCLLELGRHGDVVADLEAFAAHHPLRERPQAQLMVALRRSGRPADALAVFERYRRALASDLGIDPSAALRRLHDDIVTDAPDTTAPETATPPAPTPAVDSTGTAGGAGMHEGRYVTSFLGRDGLVANVVARLGRERLVTLVGPGGVGKTRVAAEVGRQVGGAVWFCELAGADPSSVALTVAATLGIDERPGTDHVARIADILRVQHGLVVLDNCEHVVDAAAALAEAVLTRAPAARVLATSRERLTVDGEHLCVVPPLPCPDPIGAEGEDQPAVRLFVDRARAVRPDWELTPDEWAVVAEVARRLDGLPLAIELAAARLHTLTLAEVAGGIETRFRLLTGGRRTTARHRSLAATVSWSYDLLDPAEQAMFEAVALFQAPFRAAGAAALAGCDEAEAVDLLSALVERSLAHRVGDRYGLLETLRQFGVERLDRQGRVAEVRARHARYHRDMAAAANARLHRAGAAGVLADLDASLGDLRAAQRWLADHGTHEDRLAFVLDLRDYGFYRMRPEVLDWAGAAAQAASAAGVVDPRVGDAFAVASQGAWKRGDRGRGTDLIAASAAAAEAAGGWTYRVLENLGNDHLIQGRLPEAVVANTAALDTDAARRTEFRRIEAHGNRALARGYADDPATADDVAALLDRLTAETSEVAAAWAWYTAGETVVDRDPALAADRFRRALALAEESGTLFVASTAGASAASIEARHGDPAAAVAHYRQLLLHGQRAGVRVLQWTMLRTVATLLLRIGAHQPAAVLLGAVTSTRSGHEVFGADAERLAAADLALRAALGDDAVEQAVERGRQMDDDAAVAVALAAFDDLGFDTV